MSYMRPMAGWWKRDPFFMRYMARELTAFAVLAYAVVLAVGLVRLSQGEAAFNGWLRAVQSPAGLVLHIVLFASFLVHCTSWFEIMPKTMPMLHLGGRRVSAAAITAGGTTLAVICAAAVLAAARWLP